MKQNQAEALLQYIEFHLLSFVEESEPMLADPDAAGDLYDRAYAILADIEDTLTVQRLMERKTPLTSDKKRR
jgi:hypothetical protein